MSSTPFSRAIFTSDHLIGREALEMSVSPTVNRKPPPVPVMAFWIYRSGFDRGNDSATAIVIGATVEEPAMLTEPVTGAVAAIATARPSGDGSEKLVLLCMS